MGGNLVTSTNVSNPFSFWLGDLVFEYSSGKLAKDGKGTRPRTAPGPKDRPQPECPPGRCWLPEPARPHDGLLRSRPPLQYGTPSRK